VELRDPKGEQACAMVRKRGAVQVIRRRAACPVVSEAAVAKQAAAAETFARGAHPTMHLARVAARGAW
jgi:hypothetical protein